MWRLFLVLTILTRAVVGEAGTEPPTFRFERYWPVINQPWYFQPSGIAVDNDNFIYLVDSFEKQVQKFSRDGRLVQKWGRSGDGTGELFRAADLVISFDNELYVSDGDKVVVFDLVGNFLRGFRDGAVPFRDAIAVDVDTAGNVYVLDSQDWKVKKFDRDGVKLIEWGGQGTGPGEFGVSSGVPNGPTDIDLNLSSSEIFVADTYNNRLQVFDLQGNFLREFDGQSEGTSLVEPNVVYVDENTSLVYSNSLDTPKVFTVAGIYQNDLTLSRFAQINDITTFSDGTVVIATFNPTGIELLDKFGNPGSLFSSAGNQEGFLNAQAYGLDIGPDGNLYVADVRNNRVQVFDLNGDFVRKMDGLQARYLALDGAGNIIYSERTVGRLHKVDSNGNPIIRIGDPQAEYLDLDVAADGTVYVADFVSRSIQKFDASGNLITSWGSEGFGDGQFSSISSLVLSNDGHVFVSDIPISTSNEPFNSRLQKFTTDGDFVSKFEWPVASQIVGLIVGLGIGPQGNIYAAQEFRGSVLIIDPVSFSVLGQVGTPGYFPGQLGGPQKPVLDATGRLFVIEESYNRIHAFGPPDPGTSIQRAIIVSGGGPFPGNTLWDATQASANFAYRVLAYQGFTKSTIMYLTSDLDLDLDQNGLADDVDGDATTANLEASITGGFADGIEQLVLYLVDHGGEDAFRMSATQTMSASDLATWLDQWQAANPSAELTVIYDACQSGSFIDDLANPLYSRRIISSAATNQNAYFVSQGTLSYSNFFWTQVQSGHDLAEAVTNAGQAISTAFPNQTPQVDTDGNGIPNESSDFSGLAGIRIGTGTSVSGGAPIIGSVSSPQMISATNTATLSASMVSDADGIARVWAVIRPPGFQPLSSDSPVSDLPTIEMTQGPGIGEFVGSSDIFSVAGTYQVAIYATDRLGNTASPQATLVTVDSAIARRAIIVAGIGMTAERGTAFAQVVAAAYTALDQQGYGTAFQSCPSPDAVCDSSCDNVCFLSGAVGASVDALPTRDNIRHAISTWAGTGSFDLTIFIASERQGNDLLLDTGEVLIASDLDGWLDQVQASLPGTLTVIIEGDDAQSLLEQLTPVTAKTRILIGSTGAGETAMLRLNGALSFSKYFWGQTLNGASVRQAFRVAGRATRFVSGGQLAQLDDNGNAMPNEILDGLAAASYYIGSGVLLAGDDPLLGTVQVNDPLRLTGEWIKVSDVTTTGQITEVHALVTQPGGEVVTEQLMAEGDVFVISSAALCDAPGAYEVAAVAIDANGNISAPVIVSTNRPLICGEVLFYTSFEG